MITITLYQDLMTYYALAGCFTFLMLIRLYIKHHGYVEGEGESLKEKISRMFFLGFFCWPYVYLMMVVDWIFSFNFWYKQYRFRMPKIRVKLE